MNESTSLRVELPDSPHVKLPPPLVYAVPLIGGILLSRWWPLTDWSDRTTQWAGAVLILLGLAFGLWARMIFLVRKTSVVPTRPASVLVADGPFRLSRHPMYVGFAAVYVGVALVFHSLWSLLFLPMVLIVVHKAAIEREEAYLERRFGGEYLEYKERVRGWF
jgi:protein-S-isoprenylcysteine O-methyltransferase Ste14